MTSSKISETLKKLRNDRADLEKSIDFLYNLQASQGPLSEVITLLRYDCPALHNLLKQRMQFNPRFNLLFNLTLDYEEAKRRLGMAEPNHVYL